MKKIILVAAILFSSTLRADPVLDLVERKMSEYRSRNDIVMVIFKAKDDLNHTLDNIKTAMRTRDPVGITNPYWIVNISDAEVSTKTNCGVIFGQWYARGFPYRTTWEQIMYRALQQNVQLGGYFYSLGDKNNAEDGNFQSDAFSKISKTCLEGKFSTQTKVSEAANVEKISEINLGIASQFDGSEGSDLGKEVHDVSVKLSDIDDLGFVMVQNSEGIFQLAKEVEWTATSGAGAGIVSLNKYLESGMNLVILALHNKTIAFGKNKWSYDFNLLGDGATLWHDAKKQVGRDSGIKYWMAFSVEKRANGIFSIKKASESQLIKLGPSMVDFNEWLVKNRGHENRYDAAVAIAAATATAAAAVLIFRGGVDSSDKNPIQKIEPWNELVLDPRDKVWKTRQDMSRHNPLE
jgi:hypothetical protein